MSQLRDHAVFRACAYAFACSLWFQSVSDSGAVSASWRERTPHAVMHSCFGSWEWSWVINFLASFLIDWCRLQAVFGKVIFPTKLSTVILPRRVQLPLVRSRDNYIVMPLRETDTCVATPVIFFPVSIKTIARWYFVKALSLQKLAPPAQDQR